MSLYIFNIYFFNINFVIYFLLKRAYLVKFTSLLIVLSSLYHATLYVYIRLPIRYSCSLWLSIESLQTSHYIYIYIEHIGSKLRRIIFTQRRKNKRNTVQFSRQTCNRLVAWSENFARYKSSQNYTRGMGFEDNLTYQFNGIPEKTIGVDETRNIKSSEI